MYPFWKVLNILDQESEKYSPWTKSRLLPVLVNKVLSRTTPMISLHTLNRGLHTKKAKLSSCDRDCMAYKG